MKTVNIAELKDQLSRFISEVKAGQEIIIRDRSVAVARLVPMTHHANPDEELIALSAKGRIRLGEGLVEESFWDMPAPRVSGSALRNAIHAERDGR
jgi:antitoxin (DNA-binding transcriptional repressor) of toxin-antitoxin stability system